MSLALLRAKGETYSDREANMNTSNKIEFFLLRHDHWHGGAQKANVHLRLKESGQIVRIGWDDAIKAAARGYTQVRMPSDSRTAMIVWSRRRSPPTRPTTSGGTVHVPAAARRPAPPATCCCRG
jgi:hypothetical protein